MIFSLLRLLLSLTSIVSSAFNTLTYIRLPSALRDYPFLLLFHLNIANLLLQVCILFLSKNNIMKIETTISSLVTKNSEADAEAEQQDLALMALVLLRFPLCNIWTFFYHFFTLNYMLFCGVLCYVIHHKAHYIQRKFNNVDCNNKKRASLFSFNNNNESIIVILSWIIPLLAYCLPAAFPHLFWVGGATNNHEGGNNDLVDFLSSSCKSFILPKAKKKNQQRTYGMSLSYITYSIPHLCSHILLCIPLFTISYCIYVNWFIVPSLNRITQSYLVQTSHSSHFKKKEIMLTMPFINVNPHNTSTNNTMRRRTEQQQNQVTSKGVLEIEELENNSDTHNNLEQQEETIKTIPPDIESFQQLTHQYLPYSTIMIYSWIISSFFFLIQRHNRAYIDVDVAMSWRQRIEWILFSQQLISNYIPVVFTGIANTIVFIKRGPNILARWIEPQEQYLEVEGFYNDVSTNNNEEYYYNHLDHEEDEMWSDQDRRAFY